MNAYEQALLFNNHGVALLASGSNEQREAIAKFRCALAVIKAKIIDESKKVGEDNHHSSIPDKDKRSSITLDASSRKLLARQRTSSCSTYQDNDDDNDCCDQEHARNTNILLDIQDFLEPIVIPFPEICNSGEEDGDFFLYRHGFIVSRSSSFSPSWEHSKKDKVAAGSVPNPRPRKRSFPGAVSSTTRSNIQAESSTNNDPPRPHTVSSTHKLEDPQENCGSYNPLSLDLLSSVVVFNMALAHNVEEASQRFRRIAIGVDQLGEPRGNHLSALNDVSRRLYDMSIGLLGTVLHAQEASKSVIEAMVVLAASSNNLAKILFDQGNIQTARSTLKTLWYTTSWICEKVLQQGVTVSASSLSEQQQERSVTMMSHAMRRPGSTFVSDHPTMITTGGPQNQMSSSNNVAAGGASNRNTFDDIDGNFLARTPGWERTTTSSSAFLFSETDIEGFIMNVMLMYHSQPPIAAKAA